MNNLLLLHKKLLPFFYCLLIKNLRLKVNKWVDRGFKDQLLHIIIKIILTQKRLDKMVWVSSNLTKVIGSNLTLGMQQC